MKFSRGRVLCDGITASVASVSGRTRSPAGQVAESIRRVWAVRGVANAKRSTPTRIGRVRTVRLVLCIIGTISSSCAYTYSRSHERGPLLTATPAGEPEPTGPPGLELLVTVSDRSSLDVAVVQRIDYHRPIRNTYAMRERVRSVERDALPIFADLFWIYGFLGLNHLATGDPYIGLPSLCLRHDVQVPWGGDAMTRLAKCIYHEELVDLHQTEDETTYEATPSHRVVPDGIAGGQVVVEFTSVRVRSEPVRTKTLGLDATGHAALPLGGHLPMNRQNFILHVRFSPESGAQLEYTAAADWVPNSLTIDATEGALAAARSELRQAQLDEEARLREEEHQRALAAAERQKGEAEARLSSSECKIAGLKVKVCRYQMQIDQIRWVVDREMKVGMMGGIVDRVTIHDGTSAILILQEQQAPAISALLSYRIDFSGSDCGAPPTTMAEAQAVGVPAYLLQAEKDACGRSSWW